MKETATGRRGWLAPAVVFGIWTFFGVLNATQLYVGMRSEGMLHPWRILFAWQLLNWYGWALLTPVVLWLGRRFPVTRASWARSLGVHLLFCFALTAAYTAYGTWLTQMLKPFGPESGSRGFAAMYWGRLTSQFHLSVLIYSMILGVSYALSYYAKYRERESRASQLEAQLAQAQLQALRMQLNPHFLFNTLNGIAGLVRDNRNKTAVQVIAGLSDLLRHTLETAGQQEVPLRQELEVLELYLDIQQMRFPDRLLALLEERGGAQRANKYLTRLLVKTSGRVFFLKADEIDWIEAADYYVKLHVGRKSHLLRESLSELESKLDPEKFVRIHRSTIVNLDRVREMHPLFGGESAVVLQDGTELKLSRTRRERLQKLLDSSQ